MTATPDAGSSKIRPPAPWGPETFAGAVASVSHLSITLAVRVHGDIAAILFTLPLALGMLALLVRGRIRKFGIGLLIGETVDPLALFVFYAGFIAGAIVDGLMHPGQY